MTNKLMSYEATAENIELAEISAQACFQKPFELSNITTSNGHYSFNVCDDCACYSDKGLGNSVSWKRCNSGECAICYETFTEAN